MRPHSLLLGLNAPVCFVPCGRMVQIFDCFVAFFTVKYLNLMSFHLFFGIISCIWTWPIKKTLTFNAWYMKNNRSSNIQSNQRSKHYSSFIFNIFIVFLSFKWITFIVRVLIHFTVRSILQIICRKTFKHQFQSVKDKYFLRIAITRSGFRCSFHLFQVLFFVLLLLFLIAAILVSFFFNYGEIIFSQH